MNIEQLQQIQDRLKTVLAFANAQGEAGKKTAVKIQMILDEVTICIQHWRTRNTYLLQLMLKDCVVRSLMKASLTRPTWNGRPVTFTTNTDVHQRAVDASEKIGIDIMI